MSIQQVLKNAKSGLPPGTIVFTGKKKVEKCEIHYLQFNQEELKEHQIKSNETSRLETSDEKFIDWYDMRGIHDAKMIEDLGSVLNIHAMILEDITEVSQRPKCEEYEDAVFILVQALNFDMESETVETEQVGIFFRKGMLVSFQETETDLFVDIRHRIRESQGRIRRKGTDYLAYVLMDVLVDNYFIINDEIERTIQEMEDELVADENLDIRNRIMNLRKQLMKIRRVISPMRELVYKYSKIDKSFIEPKNNVFFRDLLDHSVQVLEMVENDREMLNSLYDMYVSHISLKMNQVMKVLTVVSTIFIPMSFVAGVYGMNFTRIPELEWNYGYLYFWIVMVLIVIGLLIYFQRKKWM